MGSTDITNVPPPPPVPAAPALTQLGRNVILVTAFLGWLCAGVHMSITQLSGQPAAVDLLAQAGLLDAAEFQALQKREQARGKSVAPLSTSETAQLKASKVLVGRWFAWYQCA